MQEDEAAPSLTREASGAAWGLMALVRNRPDWALGFDASARGFVRSFLAQALALPFYMFAAAMIAKSQTPDGGLVTLWGSGLSDVMDAIAYPLVVAAVARPLKLGAGYSVFIVAVNWSSLFLNILLALSSVAAVFGREGYAVVSTAAVALFALSVFIIWRAAREALAPDLASALLMVVLAVGVGVLCDQASADLVRLWAP